MKKTTAKYARISNRVHKKLSKVHEVTGRSMMHIADHAIEPYCDKELKSDKSK